MFRAIVGFCDIRDGEQKTGGSIEQRYVAVISKAGRDAGRMRDGAMVFRSTLGVRLVVPTLSAVLVFQFLLLGLSGVADIASFLLIVGLLGWLSYYLWMFEISVDGATLRWINWTLQSQEADLAQLIRAEQDKSGGYRLEFEDGRALYFLRYVEGHGILRDFLVKILQINRA